MLSNREAGNALMSYGRGSGTFLFHPVSNVQHAIALSFVQQDNTLIHALDDPHVTKKALQDPITLPGNSHSFCLPLSSFSYYMSSLLLFFNVYSMGEQSSAGDQGNKLPPTPHENIAQGVSDLINVIRAGEMAVNASGKDAKPSWKPAYYVLFNYGSLNWFKNKKVIHTPTIKKKKTEYKINKT